MTSSGTACTRLELVMNDPGYVSVSISSLPPCPLCALWSESRPRECGARLAKPARLPSACLQSRIPPGVSDACPGTFFRGCDRFSLGSRLRQCMWPSRPRLGMGGHAGPPLQDSASCQHFAVTPFFAEPFSFTMTCVRITGALGRRAASHGVGVVLPQRALSRGGAREIRGAPQKA